MNNFSPKRHQKGNLREKQVNSAIHVVNIIQIPVKMLTKSQMRSIWWRTFNICIYINISLLHDLLFTRYPLPCRVSFKFHERIATSNYLLLNIPTWNHPALHWFCTSFDGVSPRIITWDWIYNFLSLQGLLDEHDPNPAHFGSYEFREDGAPLQYFAVQNETIIVPHEFVELRIDTNHGHLNYTCLYRFRVHGLPAE